jgi:hypothetical protein
MSKISLTCWGMLLLAFAAHAQDPSEGSGPQQNLSFRRECEPAKAQRDQAVNNVRARLTTGGDLWWDGDKGRYIVPKVPVGEPEVSAIFAAGLWMGGVDDAGNLKLAAQTYGRPSERADFWPGPLTTLDDPVPGVTNPQTCRDWDRFFTVTAEEVDEHLRRYREASEQGMPYEVEQVPQGVLGWPGAGNPFFSSIHGFELPIGQGGLASFTDADGDGVYNPAMGDFPSLFVGGCSDGIRFPDELTFWVFNDAGNKHTSSKAPAIGMEIRAYAFAYATNDALNDMTFQHYQYINRALEPLDSAYFALWVDFQLGCPSDDYIGCDTLRDMAFVYNADELDGQLDCLCFLNINTYCDEIPLLGIDLLQTPIGPKVFGANGELLNAAIGQAADTLVEVGMTSFTYYSGINVPEGGAPNTPLKYYRHMTGHWPDGTPLTVGGQGYKDGTVPTTYAFPSSPSDPNGWSMSGVGFPTGSTQGRRTVQSAGPVRLAPGSVNELAVGVFWVPNVAHPAPSIRRLQQASDFAQALFDNCEFGLVGPDAPHLDFIELDQELLIILSNDERTSNNAFEAYAERSLAAPESADDAQYVFEGYKIYQLAGPDLVLNEENSADPSRARLVAQVDIQNGIGKIYNWSVAEESPGTRPYYVPTLMVDGQDQGLRKSFRITEDAFADGDRSLINHKQYYFAAVAYAHNEYEPFDPDQVLGQPAPYLEGRQNIGPIGDARPYTAIPRPIVDRKLNAGYGEGAVVTRIDGLGTGGNFLDLGAETRAAIEERIASGLPYDGELTYAPGRAPIEITIFNPLDVVDGEFEIQFVDSDLEDDVLDQDARWVLRRLDAPDVEIMAERSIERLNEQVISEFGFSVSIAQVAEPGAQARADNGYIGAELTYERGPAATPWLSFIPNGANPLGAFGNPLFFTYISTGLREVDELLDPDGGLTQFGQSPMMPYYLLDYRLRGDLELPFISPVWADASGSRIVRAQTTLASLRNVDIVLTPDKSLWSRCLVIESASRFYTQAGFTAQGGRFHFDLRAAPSVGKEAGANGLPLPDGDGEGMGWFPGYAIDVETGQRLNIFFGENSVYRDIDPNSGEIDFLADATFTEGRRGADMMFNPSSQVLLPEVRDLGMLPLYVGGQHSVYVTKTVYDECAALRENFRPEVNALIKVRSIREIIWAGMWLPPAGISMNSYADGLVPDRARVKLRVTNPYQVETGDERTGSGEVAQPCYRLPSITVPALWYGLQPCYRLPSITVSALWYGLPPCYRLPSIATQL